MEKNSNLPEEILIEIFSRIPSKAVGRCRCLSKTWNTQLSASQFVNLHLKRRPNQQNLLLVDTWHRNLHTIEAPVVDSTVSRKVEFGWCNEFTCSTVFSSCNGLVLVSNLEQELFLVNPITLEHIKVPTLSPSFADFRHIQYRLGYDSLSDDYKVVYTSYSAVAGPLGYDRFIYVYSVKSGAWNWVATSPPDFNIIIQVDRGVFVNGAIHWYSVCKENPAAYVIDAFDLADDALHQFPAAPIPVTYGEITLLVLEGCLCMSPLGYSDNIEIWMMKQYGLADSWTKFTIATDQWTLAPLSSIGDREIVFGTFSLEVPFVVYELREGAQKPRDVGGVPSACRDGVAFVDSLVSPTKYSNRREER